MSSPPPPLPGATRRFYATATPAALPDGGFGVQLDRSALRTPAKAVLRLESLAVARLVADEWQAQGDTVVPATMPVTRLVNVALDRTPLARAALAGEVTGFAGADLVCYRAASPQGLAERQAALWDPLLAWARDVHGLTLHTTQALDRLDQPEGTLARVHSLAAESDDLRLTMLAFAAALCGSAVMALALCDGRIGAEEAFAAIRIEEDWNAAIWGQDDEDLRQALARRRDLEAVAALVQAGREP